LLTKYDWCRGYWYLVTAVLILLKNLSKVSGSATGAVPLQQFE
jgi:hypothetical protein